MTRLTTATLIAALAAAVPALSAQDEPPRKGAFLREVVRGTSSLCFEDCGFKGKRLLGVRIVVPFY